MLGISPTDRVFVLTGAGVSAESGIPTFRGVSGLWRNYRIEQVASPQAWQRDPRLVWEFYSMRRRVAATAKPNPAHFALAKLEQPCRSACFSVPRTWMICTSRLVQKASSTCTASFSRAAAIHAAACHLRTQISMSLHASFPGANAEAGFVLTSVGLAKFPLRWIESTKHWTPARCS